MQVEIFLTYKQYASASSDNLKLAGTGTGDIAEMTESLADDEAAYAYVRMKLGNDEYSERVKFAFVVWAGTSCIFTPIIPSVRTPPSPLSWCSRLVLPRGRNHPTGR